MPEHKRLKIVFVTVGAEYIGVEIMSACLKQAGHDVVALCDESVFDDKNYFTIPFIARFFNRRGQIISHIAGLKPDLVGISVITNGFLWAQEISAGLKAISPETRIIMGGVHVTCVPETVISKPSVDMICIGEGHEAMVELCESLATGAGRTDIRNIWFKRGTEIIRNPQRPETQDIDALPMIDKTAYEGEVPLHQTYLALSQYGCPFNCSYCAVTTLADNSKALGGKALRMKSVDSMIEELRLYREKYRFDSVFFMTNTFTSSKPWVMEWARKYPPAIGLPYKIATHPTRMDYETAVALKESGCYTVQLGVESFSEEVRSKIFHRFEPNSSIVEATDAMDRAGLRYTVDYIMGAPLQTENEYREAARFFISRKKLIRVTPFLVSFFPKTPLVDVGREYGMLDDAAIRRLEEGLDPNFVTSGSVLDEKKVAALNVWRLFFRLIAVLPKGVSGFLLRNDRFKFMRLLPINTLILLLDVGVSVMVRDYVALGYLRMYVWNIRKVIRRKLFGLPKGRRAQQPAAEAA